jgi:hypothetical protein
MTADWPVDWLRETGIRTMEIQRQLFHGEILELSTMPTERAEINGNRGSWRKLQVAFGWSSGAFFQEKDPNIPA